MGHSPGTLRAAAVVQAVESAVVLAGAVLAGVDTAAGRSYQTGSGIALTAIGVASAAALALVARGLAGARRWSRTPALLTQLFFGIVGIYLLQGDRLDWGVPVVVLAVAGLAALLAPPSLRALTGEGRTPPEQAGREQARREGARPEKTQREGTQREGTRPQPGQPGKASRRRSTRPGAE
ncbi:MAG TPA: hypothetical protein VKD66_11675 [Streptosporangiaceae bacterium]|nr:hypothetical protein [Streptosporangiaceae bacterium]